ncbi:c-type heme family protein, partial [Chroococcidiopsis sp.]|uniref:c-type heme family protein n=1 Tax=Chroococcidiopsis sp. TaxID=3088168 RepID=UPI003F353C63
MLGTRYIVNKLRFLQDLKLASKFNLILLFVFLVAILISGTSLSNLLQQRAQQEVTTKADVLLQTMSAVRSYTNENITPLLTSQLETSPKFIPETVAAFSAIEVFDKFRKNDNYRDYIYREAALNPTNLRDRADRFETQLIEQFTKEPADTQKSGFRTFPGGEFFYIARRFTITDASCLRCHSTPDKAPKSQIAIYGSEHGFGWQLNKTVFAQIIYVPANRVFAAARRFWQITMVMLFAISTVVLIVVNLLLKRTIIKPIAQISKVAQAVSTGKTDADFEQRSNDEIGILAASFNRMKSSLEIAKTMLERKKKNS